MNNNDDWLAYKIVVRDRLRAFALSILALSEEFPKSTRARVVNYQLTKSGTSAYANYRAALRARSKAEFFAKICIVVEEANETEMWLELIIESSMLSPEKVKTLHVESLELVKILSVIRKKNQN